MKNLKTIILIVALIVFFSSCKKFLAEDPKGLIATTTFYKTENELISAVNSIYKANRADVGGAIPAIYIAELTTDDGALGGTALGERTEIDNLMFNSTHNIVKTVWFNAYTAINLANNVIAYTDSSVVKAAICRRVIAEARFWRAFYYFRLVQLWGDVPMPLKPSSSDNLLPVRTGTTAVYSQIISDLQYAENNLDTVYAYFDKRNGGRATQLAAKALLGNVYLTMSGWPLHDQSKLSLGADKLNEIVSNKAVYGVDIMNSYGDIFNTTKKSLNTEYVLYGAGVSGQPSAAQAYTRMKYVYVSFTYVIPTNEVKTGLYEAGDQRTFVCMNDEGSRINKYIDVASNTSSTNDNADDFHYIRYSDVVLMFAECLIEMGGATNLDRALALINDVRSKHGGPSLAPLTYSSKDDLRQKYRLERRRELLFEGHRLYDLKRWGIFLPTVKAHLAIQTDKPQSEFEYISDRYNFLPIPYSDLLTNPNLTQNPGY